MQQNITLEKKDHIARIALNRPDSLNAINSAMARELLSAFDDAENDNNIRVVILTGNGRAFSAGMDLKAVAVEGADMFDIAMPAFDRVAEFKLPVIGALKGYVITGGMELALGCDIIIAADNTMFRDTHLRVGILPAGGNTQRMPRIAGEKKGKELLFTSRFLPAREAEALGLINKVVPLEKLDEEAWTMAGTIAETSRELLIAMKKLINEGMGMDFRAALLYERMVGTASIRATAKDKMKQVGKSIIERGSNEVK